MGRFFFITTSVRNQKFARSQALVSQIVMEYIMYLQLYVTKPVECQREVSEINASKMADHNDDRRAYNTPTGRPRHYSTSNKYR